MVHSNHPPSNSFVAAMRKVYNPLGFSKGYNAVLAFIGLGYIMGFTLARLEYFSFKGIFCNPKVHGASGAALGECFYYQYNPGKRPFRSISTPSCLLQFSSASSSFPIIRYKVILIHRLNGYLVIILSLISSAGTIVIAQHAFGGSMSTRTYVGALVISTTLAYLFAYTNIKRLQIDQHRAWMLRAWAYFSTIITLRLIIFSSTAIISSIGGFYTSMPCNKINFMLGRTRTMLLYPACEPFFQGTAPAQQAVVAANFNSANDPASIAAALDINFGSAGWLALWIHAIIIEFYLRLTLAESQRLRQVSYERHREHGIKHPGSGGIVAQRFGDANPYIPLDER